MSNVTWSTRAVEASRVLLLSPELVAALAVITISVWLPSPLAAVGEFFVAADAGVAATLLCAPTAVAVATYHFGTKLLRPDNGRNLLVEWPGYWRLRLRIRVALAFNAIGLLGWFVGWVLLRVGHPLSGATVGLMSLAMSLVSLCSVALANQDLGDILDGVH